MPNLRIISFIIISLTLTSCKKSNTLKIGVTAGPHAMIMEKVKEEAEKQGLHIEPIEFNDFILPNVALEEGDLDANSIQHYPYMLAQNQSKGYTLTSIGKTVLMPMGIYSSKITNLKELKEGAKIGINNDPSNEARALKLLEKNGIIKLKPNVDQPSILDIVENPKKLDIIEIEAPQILRSLDDLDCAITNTDWVVLAKMDPKSALALEDKESPYANIIAVKKDRQDDANLIKLVEIYHSKPIKDYIITEFKGAIIPAF